MQILTKMLRLNATLCLFLGSSSIGVAAPALQMHVFEAESTVMPSVESNTVSNKQLAPARKHGLKTHVFDHTIPAPVNQNAIRIATQVNHQPVLAYQRAEFYINSGYRQDDLKWSIAGIGGTPNILSELKWQDIEIATLNLGSTLYLKSNWLVNMDLVYGRIFDGKNQDSDYFGNNRTTEFSRSNNGADKGNILDISTAIGYRWQLPLNQQHSYPFIELRPQAGFSYHSQNLKMVDGFQTIPSSGAFSDLDASYDATWFGPWLGLDSQINFSDRFKLSLNLEYHHAYYDASANWNLRSDFAHPESFTHKAEGYGLVGSIASQLRLNKALALNLSVDYQDWQAHRDGIDTTYFSNGSALSTGFNGVDWHSFSANLGLIYEF